ncbi:MAG: lamin tail domain-containing protein [Bacteroidales bacterium]|nr:lamin tail domain-containing protein [Bacteroidales bacterium]
MKKHLSMVVLFLMACAVVGFAHDRKALKINEVLIASDSSVVDEYGNRGAWIELFNGNFSPLNISSVYLTNDPDNKTKYPVPLGDVQTVIAKRQHVIFWADSLPERGTFHTSFTLVPGQENWIGIYDADGETLIDEVTIPADLPVGASYARVSDGADEWEVRAGKTDSDYITPSSQNLIKDENPRIRQFAERDANGFAMTIMAMCIVFSALAVLCLCFYGLGSISKQTHRAKKAAATGVEIADVPIDAHDSGEEVAAVVMALHEHFNAHDNESFILTVKKMRRAYSPWSSKIYGLREIPRR